MSSVEKLYETHPSFEKMLRSAADDMVKLLSSDVFLLVFPYDPTTWYSIGAKSFRDEAPHNHKNTPYVINEVSPKSIEWFEEITPRINSNSETALALSHLTRTNKLPEEFSAFLGNVPTDQIFVLPLKIDNLGLGLLWGAANPNPSSEKSLKDVREELSSIAAHLDDLMQAQKQRDAGSLLVQMLTTATDAIFLLDRKKRVLFKNNRADLYLLDGGIFNIRNDNTLNLFSPKLQLQFSEAIKSVMPPNTAASQSKAPQSKAGPGSQATIIAQSHDEECLIITISSLKNYSGESSEMQNSLIDSNIFVTISNPAAKKLPLHAYKVLEETYRLTKTELQVTEHLLNGHSKKQISQEMSISEGTARWHVKNLLAKTNSNRESQMLVKMFKTIPFNASLNF